MMTESTFHSFWDEEVFFLTEIPPMLFSDWLIQGSGWNKHVLLCVPSINK